jgi:hypothetical protein
MAARLTKYCTSASPRITTRWHPHQPSSIPAHSMSQKLKADCRRSRGNDPRRGRRKTEKNGDKRTESEDLATASVAGVPAI